MSNLQAIKSKSDLELMVKDKNALARLHDDKVEEFKTNFIELWNNQYLIKNAVPSELLEFCIQVTNIGLSVNPWHRELHILPFAQKGKDGKKLEAVYSDNGIQQMAFNNGFQIECNTVWNFGGNGVNIKELSYLEQSKINFTNPKFVEEHFLGFNIELFDLNKKLFNQSFFVTYDYLKEVTKQLQSKEHQIANYKHKAMRKAYNEFFIPKGRDTRDLLSKLDNINYNEDIETVEVKETSTKDIQNALKPSIENVVKDVTIEDITYLYENADTEIKIKMGAKLKGSGWNNYTPQQLNVLKSELESI